MGLHHGLCHVLGGRTGVAHGVLNAIILPHVMRFNADAVPGTMAAIARNFPPPLAGEDRVGANDNRSWNASRSLLTPVAFSGIQPQPRRAPPPPMAASPNSFTHNAPTCEAMR
jgi:alcohol dehydrogenase class IV